MKIQIGGKFLVEKLINSMNIYLFSIVACFVFFLSQNDNKTIIEFGLRRIPELLDLGQCYLPQPSADNIDLGLNNSGYPAQPHPIIVNNWLHSSSSSSSQHTNTFSLWLLGKEKLSIFCRYPRANNLSGKNYLYGGL